MRRRDDDGYAVMAVLLVFVLLGATFLLFMSATQNQIGQSRINKQTIGNQYGNDAALARALDFLNSELTDPTGTISDQWLTDNKPGGPTLPSSAATKQTFTEDGTTYTWWVENRPASATRENHAIVHTTATTLGRTTERQHRVTAAGVGTYYTNSEGEAVYNVTPFGAWRDGLAFAKAAATGTAGRVNAGNAPGTLGVYSNATVINKDIPAWNPGGYAAIAGGITSYDKRAQFNGTTFKVANYPVTTDLNGKHAQPTATACPAEPANGSKHKGIWTKTPFSAATAGTTLTATPTAPGASCWMGMNMATSDVITVSGGGVYTLYIRDNPDLTRNYVGGRFNVVGDTQLHLVFEGARGLSGQPVVFNNAENNESFQPMNTFVFAPVSPCHPQHTFWTYSLTGSLVCAEVREPSFAVTHRQARTSTKEPMTRLLYVKDESR